MSSNLNAKLEMRWAVVRLMERFGDTLRHSLHRLQAGRTAAALNSLSDELLSDIGIARSGIPEVALRVTSTAKPTTKRRASHSLLHPSQAWPKRRGQEFEC